jgi:hypothetical protein
MNEPLKIGDRVRVVDGCTIRGGEEGVFERMTANPVPGRPGYVVRFADGIARWFHADDLAVGDDAQEGTG